MARRAERGHAFGEAFMLMKYASEDGHVIEYIWNSRDGVTPFIVPSKDGTEMRHVDWNQDQYDPNFKPQPGQRIFVDMTLEKAREYATKYVERWWDNPPGYSMSKSFASKEEAVVQLAASYLEPQGAPDIIEVKAKADA